MPSEGSQPRPYSQSQSQSPLLCSPVSNGGPLFSLSADLVSETLGGDDGDLVADSLVGLEVEGEAGIVPLDDDLGGLLDGLGTDATHVGGCCVRWKPWR